MRYALCVTRMIIHMFHKIIKFIHDLRLFLFAVILVSFLYNIGIDPISLGRFIGAKLGQAVGVSTSTSVPPNPFNTLARQLSEKEQLLNDKARLLTMQAESESLKEIRRQRLLIYFLSSGVAVLFFLIMYNYYLDFKRKKQKYN